MAKFAFRQKSIATSQDCANDVPFNLYTNSDYSEFSDPAGNCNVCVVPVGGPPPCCDVLVDRINGNVLIEGGPTVNLAKRTPVLQEYTVPPISTDYQVRMHEAQDFTFAPWDQATNVTNTGQADVPWRGTLPRVGDPNNYVKLWDVPLPWEPDSELSCVGTSAASCLFTGESNVQSRYGALGSFDGYGTQAFQDAVTIAFNASDWLTLANLELQHRTDSVWADGYPVIQHKGENIYVTEIGEVGSPPTDLVNITGFGFGTPSYIGQFLFGGSDQIKSEVFDHNNSVTLTGQTANPLGFTLIYKAQGTFYAGRIWRENSPFTEDVPNPVDQYNRVNGLAAPPVGVVSTPDNDFQWESDATGSFFSDNLPGSPAASVFAGEHDTVCTVEYRGFIPYTDFNVNGRIPAGYPITLDFYAAGSSNETLMWDVPAQISIA